MRAIKSEIVNLEDFTTIRNSLVEIEDYTDYYKHLNCTTFDMVRVSWNGYDISIFIDDEGLLKAGNLGRKVLGHPTPLFGNLIICGGVDRNGDTLHIPDEFGVVEVNTFINEVAFIVKG